MTHHCLGWEWPKTVALDCWVKVNGSECTPYEFYMMKWRGYSPKYEGFSFCFGTEAVNDTSCEPGSIVYLANLVVTGAGNEWLCNGMKNPSNRAGRVDVFHSALRWSLWIKDLKLTFRSIILMKLKKVLKEVSAAMFSTCPITAKTLKRTTLYQCT